MEKGLKKKQKNKPKTYVTVIDMAVRVKKSVCKHFVPVLTVCILCPFIIMGINYRQSQNSASMTLSLNYEEATKGLTPNGIKFNMFEISSEEIMKSALSLAGISEITPKELSDCVTVAMDSTETFSETDESTYYIATTFNIKYKQPKAITKAHISAESMLGLIGKAYKDYFNNMYADKGIALEVDLSTDEDMEYMEVYDLYVLQATQIRDYLNQRSNENSTFISPSTGETFLSVKQKMEDYINVSLSKCRAYILENGIAKNRERYVSKLEHLNSLIEVSHSKRTAAYAIRNGIIKEYDGSMISTVLVPTEDLDMKYYMSKTQTGIDYLAVDANNDGTSASAFQKKISTNNSIINHMTSVGYNSPQQIEKIENMLTSLKKDLTDIAEIAKKTDNDYIVNESNNYLIQRVNEKGFIEKADIKSTLFFTIFAWLVIFIICCKYEERKRGSGENISDIQIYQ